ncbi:MAG: PSD1 and planctomycete cytochrome C domain-containing protein [Gemmataceae bacterium]|nr:PSD1 and planctomycete cytochrome C domain-containing protein [Gemmataceae bacterium]MCI0740701.1 PSD1 and planctomycete cytochrome C domain-containing protein [Gemmataceae bacterium]
MPRKSALAMFAIFWGSANAYAQPSLPTEDQVHFFEAKIRPVFVEHCYTCHSTEALKAKKQKGNLLLDSKAGVLKGGDNGPALVPGKPNESLLLQALRHQDLKMPPKGKLPAAVIADFAKWIEMGAPDPRATETAVAKGIDFAAAKKHWAYQPIERPSFPNVKKRDWPESPIDHFILAKLEANGLAPSPPADRRTLLRRVYFDLIGLPPTIEEVESFVKDASPDAFDKVVERLLASPRYGERWSRHWLDVARYADTKDGVLMYGDDRIRPYAYTYRDYVIRSFNEDTPFDRFIAEQLAADLIEPKGEPWRLAGMGFLTLGRMFDNNIHDIIDDRIDTVTRGFLGLTVSCARCHDHKYDAIPTADYYSLYGVFANCEAPLELPVIDDPAKYKGTAEFEKQAGAQRKKMEELIDKQYVLLSETARQRVGDYLLQVATTAPDISETAIYFLSLAPTDLRPQIVNRWRRYLEHPARAQDRVFGPWPEFMKLDEAAFGQGAQAILERWQAKLNPLVKEALFAAKLKSTADVARTYGDLLKRTYEQCKDKPAPSDAQRQLFELVAGKQSPSYFPKSQTPQYLSRSEKDAYGGMRTSFDKIAVKMADIPPRAMVLHDAEELIDQKIFVRGNASAPGDPVPRQFLAVLEGVKRKPFAYGSGRLDLAKAIASPDNPLTSRVLVNRVWMHHFGEPVVSTPSDFGARSTPPSHPELLDWLAWNFMQDGWSLKKLHRHIVHSQVYQQASVDRPECRKIDPENKLLWRMHRRRLDFEAMRDAYLAVSGRLDLKMGGRPVDIVNDAKNARRSVYAFVDRQTLPNLFRAFDFASPDQSAERRPLTTVPQQALFGLNSPFLIEQAKALAARTESQKAEDRVDALYRLVFARSADRGEVDSGLRFVADAEKGGGQQLTAWQQYAQVLLLTNEFLFVD